MPSCKCFGLCGGDPLWRDPRTGLCCTLCQGSGVYTTPPTFGEQCAAIAIRGRLSHSAIVSGDLAYAVKERRKGKRWKTRRPRKTKVQRAQARRREESARLDSERQEFFASRAPDPKALDELKAEWRRNHGNRG